MPSYSSFPSIVLLADRCDDMATSLDFDCNNATSFEGSVSLVLEVENESEAFFRKIVNQTYSAILGIQPLSEDYELTYLFSEDELPSLSVLYKNADSISSVQYDHGDQTYGIFITILFIVVVSGSVLAVASCIDYVLRPRSGCWRELSCSDEESQMSWKPPVPRAIIVEQIELRTDPHIPEAVIIDEVVDVHPSVIPNV